MTGDAQAESMPRGDPAARDESLGSAKSIVGSADTT